MSGKTEKVALYLTVEELNKVNDFVKLNEGLFTNKQNLFRYVVNNLNEIGAETTLIKNSTTIKLHEAEIEIAILKEKNKALQRELELFNDLSKMEETIDVIEVVVSSDFLLTNEIKGSKNTKTYNEALAEVKKRKLNPSVIVEDVSKSERKKEAKNLMDSW